jgi:hypothetical protein
MLSSKKRRRPIWTADNPGGGVYDSTVAHGGSRPLRYVAILAACVACSSRAPATAPPATQPGATAAASATTSVPEASTPALVAPVADAAAPDASLEAGPDPHAHDEEKREAITRRFAADPRAAATALDLFAKTGDVATVIVEQDMEGGWRGKLHLVPQLPVGRYEKHLEWVRAGVLDHDTFLAALIKEAPHAVRYRWHGIELRFFRSDKHRPSAFAQFDDWSVSYDVEGSLNLDADAVRELLFHEIFHLNDADHGDWSVTALKPTYAALVARCGTRVDCLTPYAPTSTRVRNGTFYAFQPDNGEAVHEYAAELALRYYREQRDTARGSPVRHPFKCGPEENRRSWKLLTDEFFGGVDRVPPCP